MTHNESNGLGVTLDFHINTDAVTGVCRLGVLQQLQSELSQSELRAITFCFRMITFYIYVCVSGLSASPVSSSPLLPLKPWTRAASGPDSPMVIRWLLNNPQQKYRKYVG